MTNITTLMRNAVQILNGIPTIEGGGFKIMRIFPSREVDHFDPFLLLDEGGPTEHTPGEAMELPDHPHRGFETFTYMLEGSFDAHDSTGFSDTIEEGDIEWTTAGRGIIHGGGPSAELTANGGRSHVVQLWVNLARDNKRISPQTTRVRGETMPVIQIPGGTIKLIAGRMLEEHGPAQTTTPIQYAHVTLEANSKAELPITPGYNAMLYVFAGSVIVGGNMASRNQLMLLDQEGDAVAVQAGETGAQFLLIAGQPLNEPVARRGPFVMNTQEEVYQAYLDFGAGKFRD